MKILFASIMTLSLLGIPAAAIAQSAPPVGDPEARQGGERIANTRGQRYSRNPVAAPNSVDPEAAQNGERISRNQFRYSNRGRSQNWAYGDRRYSGRPGYYDDPFYADQTMIYGGYSPFPIFPSFRAFDDRRGGRYEHRRNWRIDRPNTGADRGASSGH